MIPDIKNLFTYDSSSGAKEQAITGNAASITSLGPDMSNIGAGNPVRLFVIVTEDFNNLTDLTIALQESSDDGDSDAYADVPGAKGTIPLADLVAGTLVLDIVVPAGTEKYLQLNFTVNGTAPTTGKVFAGLSKR